MKNKKLNFSAIEKKWQKRWKEKKVFQVKENPKKKKYYLLEMYPYPSASFLHVGHVRNYTIGDVYARFKRMQGFNVLYPMGYDSFGLPAESASKKDGIHPKKYAEQSIKKIMEYQKALGNSYDWSRVIASHEPDYYKWNQYFFIKMYENGLAYRKKAPVNWCENCQSVLANEEAESGKCWRCGDEVIKKDLEQWFFKITAYADRLLKDLDKIDWPEKIKTMQKNWIGRSDGSEIIFEINGEKWPVFTTRADTLFGVTFLVVSAQHPRLMDLVTEKQKRDVEKLLKKIKNTKEEDFELLEKEGVFTGSYALHPITKEEIPVWAGNFVLADYGSGMVMAVPSHDQRDFEFAKKYKIPVKIVIQPENGKLDIKNRGMAFEDYGVLANSGVFNGLKSGEAKEHITIALKEKGLGRKTINYKLRDWLISRQRYWGTPIPMIYCDKCGVVPELEKNLPVLLPEKVDLNSKTNPLKTSKDFLKVKCPKCRGNAVRETDTMGGFVDSSWYFLRYCDANNKKKPFDSEKVKYWMPVDQYIGGAEHAVMHLMYARFFVKVLKDLGIVEFNEPFLRLFNQGIVYKDGAKMSKSKGNVVYQTEISEKYGIDTARLFLMFVSSPDKQMEWSDEGVEGSYRLINKLIRLKDKISKNDARADHKINRTIKNVTDNIEIFEYPKAIVSLVGCVDFFNDGISRENYKILLKLFSPLTPHICEELWNKIGNKNFISLESWPKCDEKKINEKYEQAEKNVEKTVSDIINIINLLREKQKKEAEKVYVYVLPQEKEFYNEQEISIRVGKEVRIYAVNDKNKYDPKNWAGKAKLGRPAIYIE